ncbi:MAG: hypothetical protein JNL01_15350 [Bdellovibrionales bacterium]|nr:hypothetical protein [Bdellovibrionales bacterium]
MIQILLTTVMGISLSNLAFAQTTATCLDLSGTYLIDRGLLGMSGIPEGQTALEIAQTGCDQVLIAGHHLDLDLWTDGFEKTTWKKGAKGSSVEESTRAWSTAKGLLITQREENTPKGAWLPTTITNTTLRIELDPSDALVVSKEVVWKNSSGATGRFFRFARGTRIR